MDRKTADKLILVVGVVFVVGLMATATAVNKGNATVEPVRPAHGFNEICVDGVVYLSNNYKRQLAPKFNKESKVEVCEDDNT